MNRRALRVGGALAVGALLTATPFFMKAVLPGFMGVDRPHPDEDLAEYRLRALSLDHAAVRDAEPGAGGLHLDRRVHDRDSRGQIPARHERLALLPHRRRGRRRPRAVAWADHRPSAQDLLSPGDLGVRGDALPRPDLLSGAVRRGGGDRRHPRTRGALPSSPMRSPGITFLPCCTPWSSC